MRASRYRMLAVATAGVLAIGGGSAWAGSGTKTHGAATPGAKTGPSSSDPPYLVRNEPGVTTTSVLTVGDSVGGYRMVGIPDGLGAFDNRDGTFTVLMNHELRDTAGVARAHGGNGAFVSRWVIDKKSLRVLSGSDLIRRVYLTSATGEYVESPGAVLNRFCSADLAAPTAYYNPATRKGYKGRIFTNGEESAGGRAFGHVVASGDTYQLPDLGTANWENVVANPATGDKTVVIGTSDTGGGDVYVYVGAKQRRGNPVERAGLTGGTRYAISVADLAPAEDGASEVLNTALPFTLSPDGGTGWDRPEDGAWDPRNPNDFYFVTTASFTKHSRLWRLRFHDVTRPELGGTVQLLINGPEGDSDGPKMMDNITVTDRGQVLIQEDPGGQLYLAGIYQYDIASGALRRIAGHDPQRFIPGGAVFDTIDEESSGIIPAPFLGRGAYLLDAQNHTPLADPELVEKGQLLVMRVPAGRRAR